MLVEKSLETWTEFLADSSAAESSAADSSVGESSAAESSARPAAEVELAAAERLPEPWPSRWRLPPANLKHGHHRTHLTAFIDD